MNKQNNNIVFESEFYSPLPETVVCFPAKSNEVLFYQ